ncbi:MAG TPA: sugar phosphate isomerase/epimerase [Amaricoccus sp.]|nr:sugar phosphate isomerase/epimerase [Amaricoccus sp.]
MGGARELKVGCQTYTWEMLGDAWQGGPDDLLAAVAAGGYAGIEITDTMIGAYADAPAGFARALASHGLDLVAFTFASPTGFTRADALAADLEAAARRIDFTARFPGAAAVIGSPTVTTDDPRDDLFPVAADFCNRAAEIGRAAGVPVAIHPSSHHRTLLLDPADYERLFALLDPDVGWVPDTGHLLRGGHDLAGALVRWRERIRYLHLKDVDAAGRWAMLGTGACDISAVIAGVRAAPGFTGWLVLEEESEAAAADPSGAVRTNRATLRRLGA